MWIHTWAGKRAARVYAKPESELFQESYQLLQKTQKLAIKKNRRSLVKAKSEEKNEFALKRRKSSA
jgi:hypothetical protein